MNAKRAADTSPISHRGSADGGHSAMRLPFRPQMAADEAPEPLIPRRWRDNVGLFGSLVTAAFTGRRNSSLGAAATRPLFHEVDGNLFEVGGPLRALRFRHLRDGTKPSVIRVNSLCFL
jgi:hypothetical protein